MRTLVLFIVLCLASPLVGPAAAQTPQTAQAPGSMTLADLVAAADQRNPAIAAARQAVLAAEANIALARSGRGPTLTANENTATGGGGNPSNNPSFSSTASVTASYVIYDNGQIAYAVRQAEANLRSVRLALEQARQDTSQAVALAYLALLRSQVAVDQSQQQVVSSQELLRLAQGQFQAGVVARADVVSAQANLAAAQGNLLVAQNAVEQSRTALNTAVGFAPFAPIAVASAPQTPQLTVVQANLATLAEQRPEVRKAQANIEAAEAALLLAQAGSGLRITLNGTAAQPFAPTTSAFYSVGTTFSFPVSDAGKVSSTVAAAQANLAAARAQLASIRLTVQQQGVAALLSILSARARTVSAQAGLAFADESLRLAQGRYAAGAGTLIEVSTAETTLVLAQATLANAQFDELAGVIGLRYALGRSVVDGAI